MELMSRLPLPWQEPEEFRVPLSLSMRSLLSWLIFDETSGFEAGRRERRADPKTGPPEAYAACWAGATSCFLVRERSKLSVQPSSVPRLRLRK